LHETVANVILHGHEAGATGAILISLETVGAMVQASVIDAGRPFNPLHQPSPALPSTIQDAHAGGFGIHLVRSFADGLNYSRKDDQNIFVIQFLAR
jgi:anti-sigma regulatory factor (Ser/Thr protein kinase)